MTTDSDPEPRRRELKFPGSLYSEEQLGNLAAQVAAIIDEETVQGCWARSGSIVILDENTKGYPVQELLRVARRISDEVHL